MGNEIKWSPEQELAISCRGGAAIISAAAGSGKTAVLVERVKRMLLDENDPVKADEMVISTFTNEAAAELKERLNRALDAELEKDPGNRHLIDQRLRLEDAHISTISSFCLDLLRRNSALAGLQPGFSVLDESEAKLIYADSLKAVMEELCESEDTAQRDLLYERFAGETDRRIEDAVDTLYKFSRRLPDADRFFAEQIKMYSSPENMNGEAAQKSRAYLEKKVISAANELSVLCDELQALAGGDPAGERYCAGWRVLCDSAKRITDTESCKSVYESELKTLSVPALRRSSKTFDNSAIKEPHAQMKKLWEGLVQSAGLFSRRNGDMLAAAPVLEALVSLMNRLDSVYSARKREKSRVDFNDIELMTLRMLRNDDGSPSETAKETARGIKVIIVDEFQDSNDIQYEIFRLISDNKRNLYFVGDIKQSIYRFRGADPLVFSRLMKDPDFTVIDLNRNFRSCAEVIDSVNAIFTGTMTEELGDVDYDESCALVRGAVYNTDEKNRTELITFRCPNIIESRKNEAAYIADRIRSMVAEGFKVTDGSVERPCGYGDFAVLMRSYSSNISLYKAAFDRAGIPFDAKDSDEFTDFSEVRLAAALLRVIDDPYRDTDLAAVLMCEPFMMTEQDMAEIKLLGGRGKSLWTGLRKYAKVNGRAAAILDEINGYRRFAEENSAERLLRKICDESGIIPAAEASPDGAKRSANLHKLIYYAQTFSGGESAGLYDFIRFMESLRSGRIRLPQAKGGSSSAVRLMTIHGSKGLEFPVCFVSNLSSRAKASTDEIICDPSCGIGMKINDSDNMLKINTQMYSMVSDEILRLDKSEEMRLLYVAATRAREKLIFTAPLSSDKPDMHYGWIAESRAVKNGLIDVRNYSEYKPAAAALTDDGQDEEPELPAFTDYKYSRFSAVPAKVTATQIGVKSVDDYAPTTERIERFLRVPSFLSKTETSRLTGKKRGDAYHKVMELLDLSAKAEDVPAILDRLRDTGKLSETERLSVSEKDIAAFLASDICRRAAASGCVNREFPIFCEYEPEAGEWGAEDWTGEEKPFIQGIADMFFIEDGEIVLVDYKTNSNTTAEHLIEEYRGQLDIYARALSEATGMRVRQKLLYSFELGEIEIV